MVRSVGQSTPIFDRVKELDGSGSALDADLLDGNEASAFQGADADLDTWASLTPSANAQSLVTAANYAAMRGLLDLEAGTDFYSISAANAAFAPAFSTSSFTPTLDFETTGDLSVAYTTQSGTYFKIDDMVWIELFINASSFTHSTAADDLLISGLPFGSATTVNNIPIGQINSDFSWNTDYTQIVAICLGSSSTDLKLRVLKTGAASHLIDTTDLPSGSTPILNVVGWYRTS